MENKTDKTEVDLLAPRYKAKLWYIINNTYLAVNYII